MIKDELRSDMRAKRRAMTDLQVRGKSQSICRLLFSLDCIKNAKTVCTFIAAFKEPDTAEIIQKLRETKKTVAVPVTDTENITLSLSYIDGLDSLKKGAYGIPEPEIINIAHAADMEVILVPGLAFDKNGGRMGFGKGYYDRLLSDTRAVKIGLCYEFQLYDNIPTEPHDVPMDLIITEEKIWRTGK